MVVVLVKWIDASYERGECSTADAGGLAEATTAGILVKEDDESLTLALDWFGDQEHWRFLETIPKVCVRSIRRINAR